MTYIYICIDHLNYRITAVLHCTNIPAGPATAASAVATTHLLYLERLYTCIPFLLYLQLPCIPYSIKFHTDAFAHMYMYIYIQRDMFVYIYILCHVGKQAQVAINRNVERCDFEPFLAPPLQAQSAQGAAESIRIYLRWFAIRSGFSVGTGRF